jgi:hypothetical protein
MSHFGDVPKKVRVFSLKKLFLKRFTVGSTTRTLITDKTDHSAFTHYYSGGGVVVSQKTSWSISWSGPQNLKKT